MMYADDLQLYRSCEVSEIPQTVNKINQDLTKLASWCSNHGMQVNEPKTKVMVLGYTKILSKLNRLTIPKVVYGATELEYVQKFKNLGIMIEDTLSWESQVSNMCNSVFKSLYQLRRVAADFPVQVRKQLAQSLILPIFDYAPVALCDLKSDDIDRLQKTQNAVVRFVLRVKMDEHITPYFKKLGWLKIAEKKKLQIAVMMFKILKFQRPHYLYNEFKWMAQVHDRETRNRNKIMQIPIHRTVLFNRSFIVQGIKFYNEHVDKFKLEQKTETFRNDIKNMLLDKYE
uniref:Reverse transcriptase domain-containing protein n=1 Tax=Lygus hesperus TaxID=30085 RepID=A0A146M7M2_LYGHE